MARLGAPAYSRCMRVNFLALSAMVFLLGLFRLFVSHAWFGGVLIALAIAGMIVHFIRIRRFKRHDEARNSD